MNYQIMIRSIPKDTIPEVHSRIISVMNGIPKPWGFEGDGGPSVPDCGKGLLAQVKLLKYLGPGVRGSIVYNYRGCQGDDDMYDDFMVLEFNPAKHQYSELLRSILPRYIKAFPAYLAFIRDDDWILIDREEMLKTAPNRRTSVHRIYPVHYFNDLLCLRAFKKTPAELIKLLSGECEHIELMNSGVYLIATSKIIGLEEANQINDRLLKLIR